MSIQVIKAAFSRIAQRNEEQHAEAGPELADHGYGARGGDAEAKGIRDVASRGWM